MNKNTTMRRLTCEGCGRTETVEMTKQGQPKAITGWRIYAKGKALFYTTHCPECAR